MDKDVEVGRSENKDDGTSQVYASVSAKHKANKRLAALATLTILYMPGVDSIVP